jgi:hypothetical protein
LTWDRVDFDAGTIDLKIKEIIDALTKEARKDRSKVKMTEEARGALLQAKQGARTGYVIEWNDNAREVHQEGFPGRRGARAGLPSKVTPHVLAEHLREAQRQHAAAGGGRHGPAPAAQAQGHVRDS